MKIVFFTGAGISKDSGLSTYRDLNGIWSDFNKDLVARKGAWEYSRKKTLEFHNELRIKIENAEPNEAHLLIASLEKQLEYDVCVITQNVDNLHQRAGSSNVLHLHGSLFSSRSISTEEKIVRQDELLKFDETNVRYSMVLFGEEPLFIQEAKKIIANCDLFIIVGCSMNVYPAAGLPLYLQNSRNYLVDINADISRLKINIDKIIYPINETAIIGLKEVLKMEQLIH